MNDAGSEKAHRSTWFWYWMAVACGVVALGGGVGIFVLWVVTAKNALMSVGVMWVLLGLALFVAGLLCLFKFRREAMRRGAIPTERRRLATRCAGWLLVSSFPAAVAVVLAVWVLTTSFFVTVENRADGPLEDAQITIAQRPYSFGTIAPGKSARVWIRPIGEGNMQLDATLHGRRTHWSIYGLDQVIDCAVDVIVNDEQSREIRQVFHLRLPTYD